MSEEKERERYEREIKDQRRKEGEVENGEESARKSKLFVQHDFSSSEKKKKIRFLKASV